VHLQKIASTRLANQQIAGSAFTKVNELISHMGAIQAQDYAMAKWAIGKRLPHATDDSVEAAIAKGEILRIHLLRPTWHLVAADDIHWLLVQHDCSITIRMATEGAQCISRRLHQPDSQTSRLRVLHSRR